MRKSRCILTVLMLITILSNQTSAGHTEQNKEINQMINDPPFGANIDEALSDYYGVPTAIENGVAYFNIEGSWYTFEDFTKYPHPHQRPFPFQFPFPDVHAPVSNLVSIGFLGIALVIFGKISGINNGV